MGKVKDILKEKGDILLSVKPDTVILNALRLMSEKNVGALVVLDNEALAGIFSERDYARKVILKGRTSLDTLVKEIMTQDVFTVSPEASIEECMQLMTNKRIRHLPVVLSNKVVGVISIGDVVKYIIEDQGMTIEYLRQYMSGS